MGFLAPGGGVGTLPWTWGPTPDPCMDEDEEEASSPLKWGAMAMATHKGCCGQLTPWMVDGEGLEYGLE